MLVDCDLNNVVCHKLFQLNFMLASMLSDYCCGLLLAWSLLGRSLLLLLRALINGLADIWTCGDGAHSINQTDCDDQMSVRMDCGLPVFIFCVIEWNV